MVVLLLAALYALSPYRWNVAEVGYYINPRAVNPEAASAAIRYAAEGWNAAGANIQLRYLGTHTTAGIVKDGLSTVSFVNATHPSGYSASTSCWWTSGNIKTECDVAFYEPAARFFVGGGCTTGTPKGAYIEQLMAHEFGHVLSLQHTTVSGATMQATGAQCSLTWLTLAGDDINGLRAQYPQ